MESPNTKTFLLLQAHFSRLTLPCSDYYTDLKSVLDQTIRILQVKSQKKILKVHAFLVIWKSNTFLQAMIDVSAESGWLTSTLRIMNVMQMVVQARWIHDSPFLMLPRVEPHMLHLFRKRKLEVNRKIFKIIFPFRKHIFINKKFFFRPYPNSGLCAIKKLNHWPVF